MPTPAGDSTPLGGSAAPPAATAAAAVPGPRQLFALLLIFLVVSSDAFSDGVLSAFRGSKNGRSLTAWGALLQGGSLCGSYWIGSWLISRGVL